MNQVVSCCLIEDTPGPVEVLVTIISLLTEYFKLYTETSKAVKEVNENFKVGGPAICGGADEKWMKGFLGWITQS